MTTDENLRSLSPARSKESENEDEDEENCHSAYKQWQDWTIDDVAQQLRQKRIPEYIIQKFIDHHIDGSSFYQISRADFETKLGINRLGILKKLEQLQKDLVIADYDSLTPDGSKIFNDLVHGHMEFHPLCVAIIDTPQFQRLRNIKQLGACYFVYPGASHNRFEHSLGVGHLAGQLVDALRKRQPRLGITDEDVLCLQIAGLCHDLGHGPFSHLFETFICCKGRDWKHEEASLALFDYMLKENNLEHIFRKYGLTSRHVDFIKDLITGKDLNERRCEYGKCKDFLYEIVANKITGVDVDKWDYINRDGLHLDILGSFDHKRFIKFIRVVRMDKTGRRQICVREKEAFDIFQMFFTRLALHRKAYNHKAVQAIHVMLLDALKEADKFIRIPGSDDCTYSISECIDHMDAYTNLTDSVIDAIILSGSLPQNSTGKSESQQMQLKEKEVARVRAKQLVLDIQRRQLYKCVGESVPISEDHIIDDQQLHSLGKDPCEDIKEEIFGYLERNNESENVKEARILLKTRKCVVQVADLDFGLKEHKHGDCNGTNSFPAHNLGFFTKGSLNKTVPVRIHEVSTIWPQVAFREQVVRVFLQPTGNSTEDTSMFQLCRQMLQKAFKEWCLQKHAKEPKSLPGYVEDAPANRRPPRRHHVDDNDVPVNKVPKQETC